jgi:hypothetical protein
MKLYASLLSSPKESLVHATLSEEKVESEEDKTIISLLIKALRDVIHKQSNKQSRDKL